MEPDNPPARDSRIRSFQSWNDLRDRIKSAWKLDDAIAELAGVKLVKKGSRQFCLCPFHNEKTPSFFVNSQKGFYKCFGAGCGASGDLIRFIMDYKGLSYGRALSFAAERLGISDAAMEGPPPKSPPARPKIKREVKPAPAPKPFDWEPAPSSVKAPGPGDHIKAWQDKDGGKSLTLHADDAHEYRDCDGSLICLVIRREFRSGQKSFIPLRWGDVPDSSEAKILDPAPGARAKGWIVGGPPAGFLKPVYGMEHASKWIKGGGRKILIVEGEKTCDAARQILLDTKTPGDWIALSPMGGSSAARMSDWERFAALLAPRTKEHAISVCVWPDADKPVKKPDGTVLDRQEKFAMEVMKCLLSALQRHGAAMENVSASRYFPMEERQPGWDLADARNEKWEGRHLLMALEKNSRPLKAQDLS